MLEVGFEPTHPKILRPERSALDHSAIQAGCMWNISLRAPRIELGTYCVLSNRHNQLDQARCQLGGSESVVQLINRLTRTRYTHLQNHKIYIN